MGRNKNPEQTRERILDTAVQLFVEKGYEETSIQDILDALNLSKGGIYHHFRSKEEILEAVMQKRAQYAMDMLHEIIQNTTAGNAKEKLKKILYRLATDMETNMLDSVINTQINPRFVVGGLQACVNQDAPIIGEIIEEGVKDGSFQTAQPAYCAEIFLLLLNFWLNPVLFGRNNDETKDRLVYLQSVMHLLGVDIIDDKLITALLNSYQKISD
ncbi:TetR/AcrR family transcriptional regulator [Diplocloster agilis]|uniref:TetR/AcrR family transcriptional regulator n=1 Tax=Diplocloster agilis TaxID=2850323 RepID=A0A949K2R5_9FIRM|nr:MULTISPECIES: TetR/AcrR family transcriptional regulator [Lachnospiraceae]MBU9738237.1 TetR/AcrR family transcriptional regulator [Diplocloster agilis]MCU6735760.1 TetR/AcrR family transcriptional regulator [Suonthocola fibrivorans]SCJ81363.1 HTH-type transcriptional repressor KstR2 [uncultured Clostridium sp.]